MQKILVLVAVIFSLAAAGLGYLNRSKLIETKTQAASYKDQSDDNARKLQKTSADLKTANEKFSVLDADSQKVATENTDLKSQVSKDTSLLADLQKQISDKDSQIAQQKTDMAAKDSRISELESKASQAAQPAAPSDDLKKQLAETELLNSSLQTRLKEQDGQLLSLKEKEAQRKAKTLRIGLEGKILAVNSSWNFVVLSLGDRNGVVNGAEMLIKRGSLLVGKVRITSVEPSTSIADIVPNSIRGSLAVQPGDTVIYSGPGEDNEPKLP